jgi:hypothetical protein
VGYLYVFNGARKAIRHEIKQTLKKGVSANELHVFKVNINETASKFKWENHKEFWFEGNIYDVVSKKQIQDTLIYYCINDLQEKHLFERLNEYVHKALTTNNHSSSKNKVVLIKPIQLFYHQSQKYIFREHGINISFAIPNDYQTWVYIDVPTPPPKLSTL